MGDASMTANQIGPRIVLVHATRLAIAPIEAAFSSLWPQAEPVSVLEEALSRDRARSKALSEDLVERIELLAHYGEKLGAMGILFTCSAFGSAIERAAARANVPVLKPNEAMFRDALQIGGRIALVHTFAPAGPGLVDEFDEQRSGAPVTMQPVFCDRALNALAEGDLDRHDTLIADCVAGLESFDAIVLAQFSMARAANKVRARTDRPVLTSPDSAVLQLRQRIEGGT